MAELTCVKTFAGRMEAELAQSTLESNGIKSTVSVDDAGGMRPDLAFTSGGAKLLVLEPDAEAALKVLEERGDGPE